MTSRLDGVDIQLLLVIVFYILCCPFTKVEESFNMQALFDMLHFGVQLSNYDHLEFPGVVPRSFLGSLVIALLALPFHAALKLASCPPLYNQIACRCILGAVCWISFVHFRQGVAFRFGKRASQLTIVLTAFQFHICFYMSRTLPNTFALILCLNAFGYWLKGKPMRGIAILTVATVIFRCDVLVFLAPFTLQLLLAREIPVLGTIKTGIICGVIALTSTVIIDSVMWQKWVWPEGVVLFFNTVENRSSEWGTMPVHWYFTNALLKSLNLTWVWILCGILGFSFPHVSLMKSGAQDASVPQQLSTIAFEFLFAKGVNRQVIYYITPAIAFVVLYSILPHKELRFIFPALPLLTMAGGVGMDRVLPADSSVLWYPLNLLHPDPATNKMKKLDRQRLLTISSYLIYRSAASLIVLLNLVAMMLLSSALLSASSRNYPGAEALDRLLKQHIPMDLAEHPTHLPLSDNFKPVFVHIDAAAAMTGITRFLQRRFIWGPTNKREDYTYHRNYLNLNPSDYDHSLNLCFFDSEGCEHEDVDVVYYSKDENISDYAHYDWIITADPT